MACRWGAAWEVDAAPNPPLDVRIIGQNGSEVRACRPFQQLHNVMQIVDAQGCCALGHCAGPHCRHPC
jgi:hypothetical protein